MHTQRRLLVTVIISLVLFFSLTCCLCNWNGVFKGCCWLQMEIKWTVELSLTNFYFQTFFFPVISLKGQKLVDFWQWGFLIRLRVVCGYWSERLLPLLHAVITLISLLSIVFPLSEEKGSRGRSIGSHWSVSKRSPEWAHLAQKQTRST